MAPFSDHTPPGFGAAPEPLARAVSAWVGARVGRPCVPPEGEAGVALSGGPGGWVALAMPCIVHDLPSLTALAPGGWATDGANLWVSREAAEAALEEWANRPGEALAQLEEVLFVAAERAVGRETPWPSPWAAVAPETVAEALAAAAPVGPVPWAPPGDAAALVTAVHALATRWPERWPMPPRWAELAASAPSIPCDAPGSARPLRLWEAFTRPTAVEQRRRELQGRLPSHESPSERDWLQAIRELKDDADELCGPGVLANPAFALLVKALAALPLGTPTHDMLMEHTGHPDFQRWKKWSDQLRWGVMAMCRHDRVGIKKLGELTRRNVCPDAGVVWESMPLGIVVAGRSQHPDWQLSQQPLSRSAARAAALLGHSLTQPAAMAGSEPWVLGALALAEPGSAEERDLVDQWLDAGSPALAEKPLAKHLLDLHRYHALAHVLSVDRNALGVFGVADPQVLSVLSAALAKPPGRRLMLEERLKIALWAKHKKSSSMMGWANNRTRVSDLAQQNDLCGLAVLLTIGSDPTAMLFDAANYGMKPPTSAQPELTLDQWCDRVLAAGADPFFQFDRSSGFVDSISAWDLASGEFETALRGAWSRHQAKTLERELPPPDASVVRRRL